MTPHGMDPQRAARRQIMRRATLYSLGFMLAGIVIAVAGAALVAWLLSRGRLPFLETWIVVLLIIVLPGLIATVWKTFRGR
jgi:high-affinity Fe2+/Pb2+ permease